MATNRQIELLQNNLIQSQWPKCNDIAKELSEIGSKEAQNALIAALKGAKRHHARTAAIKELEKFNDLSILDYIEPFLDDKSYETRMAAKHAIITLTGREVTTAKGE